MPPGWEMGWRTGGELEVGSRCPTERGNLKGLSFHKRKRNTEAIRKPTVHLGSEWKANGK